MVKKTMSPEEQAALNAAMQARVGLKRDPETEKRVWPKLDVLGCKYLRPAHTVRGVGGNAEKAIPNTHFVVLPAGIAGHLVEAAVDEVVEWLEEQPQQKKVRPASGEEKASS